MKSNYIVIGLLLLIIGSAVFSIVQDMARQAMFDPVCRRYGYRVMDTGPMNKPKCLDSKTGLLYVPPELQDIR